MKWTCILLVILLISCGGPAQQEGGLMSSMKGDSGYLFENGVRDAVLRNFINDTTINITVIRNRGSRWDTIFSQSIERTGQLDDGLVEIKDFNGDHIPDLKILKAIYHIHYGEETDLWLYQHNQFRKVKGFDQVVSPKYDEKTGLVYGYRSAGCADMVMNFGTYRIVADSVQTIQQLLCDCCQGDSCTITINGERPFKVRDTAACEYVPEIYADGVKWKCEL